MTSSRVRAAVAAVLVAVVAAQYAESCLLHHMVVEETCERREVVPACAQQQHLQMQPQHQQQAVIVGIPYPQVVHTPVPVAVPVQAHQQPCQQHHVEQRCACGGSKRDGTCTCGGSKRDGTCTCGQPKPTCGCATCEEKKKSCDKVSSLAEEGISTLFKVVRGGMKMVEHLADSIKKKEACCPKKKPCGCCGCGGGCAGGCGGGPGCHAAVPVLPVVVGAAGCGCGCGR